MVIQEDGKILLAGTTTSTGQVTDFGMVRYNIDGSNDFDFGFLGFTGVDFGGNNEHCYSAAIQLDNKIVLAGYSANVSSACGESSVVHS